MIMDLDHLNNLRWRVIEAERLKERIERLRTIAESCTAQITGMPKGSGVGNKTWDRLADAERKYEQKIAEIECEKLETEDWINECNDAFMRLCLARRFVDGMTWKRVALSIGGGNTATGCRVAVMRFLGVYK